MTNLYVEESFEQWPAGEYSESDVRTLNGWRLVTTGGAEGGFELERSDEGPVLRITRRNVAGQIVLDQASDDLRAMVPPGARLFVRVWARKLSGDAALTLCLCEYEGVSSTGRRHRETFSLTSQFTPLILQATTSPLTTEICLSLQIENTGTVEIQRIEIGRMESVTQQRPRILLPQGRVLESRPVLWWQGPTHQGYQIQLTKDLAFSTLVWDSSVVETSSSHHQLPEQAAGRVVFARVRVRGFNEIWSEWSEPTVVVYSPLPQLETETLIVYDLNPTRQLPPAEAFEQAHLVSALQGLANREKPRLFLRWMPNDDFWLDRLKQPERYLERAKVETVEDLDSLLERFSDAFDGVVLWDPNVPATSNVASTIAGVENLLPIPLRDEPGSLYQRLVTGGSRLPVKRSLVDLFTGSGTIPDTGEPSSGSAKNDAYRWAIAQYIESGKCNPERMGYYIDAYWTKDPEPGLDYFNHTLTNHDFFIMHRGFFWDLNVWPEEVPVDDPGQPLGTDYETLMRLLTAASSRLAPGRMIHCGGFTPWAFKYTDYPGAGGKWHGVQTEWETVRILSAFDAFLDADALHLSGLANASVYAHMPRPERINQAPPPLREDCVRQGWMTEDGRPTPRNFLIHYVGDYDAAAWVVTQIPAFWTHFRRGQVKLPWSWNPNLMERGMPTFDEYLRTRTPWDFLWSGDSGAGYINPTQLFAPREPSGRPENLDLWIDTNARWFRMLDLRHVGFVITGRAPACTPESRRLYQSFAADGLIEHDEFHPIEPHLEGSMPVIPMMTIGLPEDIEESAKEIRGHGQPGRCRFITVRSVLRDPQYYHRVNREVRRRYPEMEMVDLGPGEFFYLLRQHLGGENSRRAAFVFDRIPKQASAGGTIEGTLWLRNIGWNTWEVEGPRAVEVAVELASADRRTSPARIALPKTVAPGQLVEIKFQVPVPADPGVYSFRIDLVEGAEGWFSDSGNLPESRPVRVV